MKQGAMMISPKRFAGQLGANFRGRITNEYGGTLEDPCPTSFIGGLNWCGSGDYKGWIRAAQKQRVEIQRKEEAIAAVGIPLSQAAEGYRLRYTELYEDLDPVGWDAWNTREKVMRTISIMEVGAAYEDTLARVMEDGGLEVDESKPPLFKFRMPWGWLLTLGGAGLVGYALTKTPAVSMARKLTQGMTK